MISLHMYKALTVRSQPALSTKKKHQHSSGKTGCLEFLSHPKPILLQQMTPSQESCVPQSLFGLAYNLRRDFILYFVLTGALCDVPNSGSFNSPWEQDTMILP